MKILILLTTLFLFSCTSPQYTSSSIGTSDEQIEMSTKTKQGNSVFDLTEEIRKQSAAYVTGAGVRASIYVRNQPCRPLLLLDGSQIPDYRTLYNLVPAERFESVKVIRPQQASLIYGLRGVAGVILVTTKADYLVAE